MLKVLPRSFSIRNFKCLKELDIVLDKLNIVIGPNGSGKTSLVEAFLLLKLILNYIKGSIMNPFLQWWGYRNAVWRLNEKLNIELKIGFSLKWEPPLDFYRETFEKQTGHPYISLDSVYYNITVSGIGGKFHIINEELYIKDYEIKLRAVNNRIRTFYKDNEIQVTEITPIRYLLELVYGFLKVHDYLPYDEAIDNTIIDIEGNFAFIPSNILKDIPSKNYDRVFIDFGIVCSLVGIYKLIDRMVILPPEAFFRIREPSKPIKVETISPYGEDLASLISTIYGGRLPEHIRSSLEYVLDEKDIDVKTTLTSDGRIYLELIQGSNVFEPPSIPSGLLKVLAIEIALDINSPLLIIDEIENSLHIRAIHRVLDDIRNSDVVLVATTHSPALLDLVKPFEVIVLERKRLETIASRLSRSRELEKKLRKLGVSLGEYLTYIST